ncbi:phosphatidylinositol phosphatase PTPRQ [Lissotriton helveticus]
MYSSEQSNAYFEILSPNTTRKKIVSLFPGHRYSFLLSVRNPRGTQINLSPVVSLETRPFHPQNVRSKKVSSTEIVLQWDSPNDTVRASFHSYIVSILDVEDNKLNAYSERRKKTSTTIYNIKPYHQYRIRLQSIAEGGTLSCSEPSLLLITGVSPPEKVWAMPEDVGEDYIVIQWQPTQGEDQFKILLKPDSEPSNKLYYLSNSTNEMRIHSLLPGETYEIGVTSVKNGNMSEMKTIRKTLKPKPVQIAVPYELHSKHVVLFVQMPDVGLFDGILVARTGMPSTTFALKSDGKITIEDLIPGTEYEFYISTISKTMHSSAYQISAVKTCLSSPVNVREGAVTETSVEITWNRADGNFQHYEITCINCAATFLVQKVIQEVAVFPNLNPGTFYNFSVRTEKEHFKDSESVFIEIQTVPSPVAYLNHTTTSASVTVDWGLALGRFDGYIISINNKTFHKEEILLPSIRTHRFDNLFPGSDYLISFVTTSLPKKSRPTGILVRTCPEPPSDLQVFGQEESTLYLSWKLPPGGYKAFQLIYHPLGRIGTVSRINVNGTRARVENLIPGVEYLFKIMTVNGRDTSVPVEKKVITKPPGICGLSVVFKNTTSATLTWTPAAGSFTHYKIYLSNGTYIKEDHALASITAYGLTGLTPGGIYNFTVQRMTRQVEGTVAFIDLVTEPEEPRGLRAFNVSSHSFSLRWRRPRGRVERYRVELAPRHGFVAVRELGGGEYQADVSGTIPGASYTVTVSTVSASVYSSPVSKSVTTNETIPGAPTSLGGERVGSAGILLSWSIPKNTNGRIVSYAVKFKEVCPWLQTVYTQLTVPPDNLEVILTNLNPGTTYEIKVAAGNSAGIGLFSEPLLFQTAESAPGKVVNLTVEAISASAVNMTWFLPRQPNGKITSFKISVKHARSGLVAKDATLKTEDILGLRVPECNEKGESFLWSTTSPTSTRGQSTTTSPSTSSSSTTSSNRITSAWDEPITYVVDHLRPYTTYLFEVSAVTIEPGYIDSAIVRTPESIPEDPPQNLVKGNITGRSFSLTWDTPTIPTGKFSYRVELFGPLGRLLDNSTKDLKFTFTNLTPYTTYDAYVSGETSAGVGPKSNISVFTPTEAPSSVSDLKVKQAEANFITIEWRRPQQPNGIITQYRVKASVTETGTTIENTILTDAAKDFCIFPVSLSSVVMSSKKTGFKLCEECGKMMSITDPHDECLWCLSSDHDVQGCRSCLKINRKALCEREAKLLVAKLKGKETKKSLRSRSRCSKSRSRSRSLSRSASKSTSGHASRSSKKKHKKRKHGSRHHSGKESDSKVKSSDSKAKSSSRRHRKDMVSPSSVRNPEGETVPLESPEKSPTPVSNPSPAPYQSPGHEEEEVPVPQDSATPVHQPEEQEELIPVQPPQEQPLETWNLSGLPWKSTQWLNLTTFAKGWSFLPRVPRYDYKRCSAENGGFGEPENASFEEPPAVAEDKVIFPEDSSICLNAALLEEGILQTLNVLAPLRTARTKTISEKWYTPNLKSLKKTCQIKEHLWRKSKDSEARLNYVNARKQYILAIKQAKKDYFTQRIQNNCNSTKELFKIVKELGKPPSTSQTLTPSTEACERISTFFSDKIKKIYSSFIPQNINLSDFPSTNVPLSESCIDSLNSSDLDTGPHLTSFELFSTEEVLAILNTIKSGSPSDPCPHFVFSKIIPVLCPLITQLFNKSLTTATFPQAWKHASVTPLLKKAGTDILNPENYRPISQLPFLSKALEKLVNIQLTKYLETNSLLDPSQTGFRANNSTEATLLAVSDNIRSTADQGGAVALILLDLSAAFDTVSHDHLLHILRSKGVQSKALGWLHSFLSNRTQAVHMGQYHSKPSTIGCGYPNGSAVLSPAVDAVTVYEGSAEMFSTAPTVLPVFNDASDILTAANEGDVSSAVAEGIQYGLNISAEQLSYVVKKLVAFTEYTISVSAFTIIGEGPPSNITVRTREQVPSSVEKINYENISSTSILLLWEPPLRPNGMITHYTIYAMEVETKRSFRMVTSNNSYIITDLKKYTDYKMRVTASTTAGESSLSEENDIFVRTLEDEPGSPPLNLMLIGITARSVSLEWAAPSEPNGIITHYEVLYRNSSGLHAENTSAKTMTLSYLKPYTLYNISVRAYTRIGHGNQSTSALPVRTLETAPGSPPYDLSYRHINSTELEVSWQPPVHANGVILFYSVRYWNQSHVLNVTSNYSSVVLSYLRKFSQYAVDVSASTIYGNGNQISKVLNMTTLEDVPDDSPHKLSYSNLSSSSIRLFYFPPSYPNGVIQYFTVSCLGTDGISRSVNSSYLFVVLSGLSKYSDYSVAVSASTSAGTGPQTSKPLFVRTDEDAPDSAPENITYRNISSTEVVVSFLPPAIPNGIIRWHTIYLQMANGTEKTVINTTNLSQTITGLKKHTAYTLEISSSTSKGEGVRSATLSIMTEEDAPSSPPRAVSVKQLSDVIVKLSWKPPLEPNGIILYYTVRVWNDFSNRYINSTETSLQLTDLENNNEYNAYIIASTRFGTGNIKSETVRFRTSEGAPSDPPKNVSYTNLTSTSILVIWSPPSKPNGIILYYSIYYKNSSDTFMQNFTNDDIGLEIENVSLSAILDNLATFTSYELWITSSTSMGDGNQTSDSIYVYTDQDIPGDSVRNLTVLSRTSQSILLCWLPPLKPNGHLTSYELTLNDNQTFLILPGLSITSFNLTGLKSFTKYQIRIFSFTVKGRGPGILSTIETEESIPDGPVQNLNYQNVSSTAVNVSWLPPSKPNGIVFYRVTLKLRTSQVGPELLRLVTHENSKLIDGLKKYTDYILNITPGTKKGYAESHTLQLHFQTEEDVPETSPVIITYKNLTSTSVLLSWDPPFPPTGVVTGYSCHLMGPEKNDSFTTSINSTTLQNLLPFTVYHISVAARTSKGLGPAGLFAFHTDESVPGGAPQNLTVVNYTSETVWLKWHPPQKPNGVIQVYNFKIWENSSDILFYQNTSGMYTEAQLKGLEPFTTYFIRASAYTKYGNGNHSSNTVSFTTKESAPDIVQNVQCTATSWQSILVQWDAPTKPNGLITHYIIVFQSTASMVAAHEHVNTIRELLANTTYHFKIRAATSAGIGGEQICNATTPPEEVPSAPKDISFSNVSSTSITLRWTRPDYVPGYLRNYKITTQLQSTNCNKWEPAGCVQSTREHYLYDDGYLIEKTMSELKKFRWYRFNVAASTSSGYGSSSAWISTQTLPGSPEGPPENVTVIASSNQSIIISWREPTIITGPTTYLINVSSVETSDYSRMFNRTNNESYILEVFDLKPFTKYSVVVIAITGETNSKNAGGASSIPVIITTLEGVPKDPPSNLTYQKMPNEVTKFHMTFKPPSEPNGHIQVYQAIVYPDDDPANSQIRNLTIISNENNSITAVIDGLKGGHTYKINVYAVNGAGAGPNMQLKVTMDTKEPPLPTKRPVPVYDSSGTLVVSSTTITIRMPICYFNDDHGPIKHLQVLVAEAGVQHEGNITKWHEAYFKKPRPYFTNEGFPNPECSEGKQRFKAKEEVYVIGADNNCMLQIGEDKICNGPLKPRKQYLFKFRATNMNGQFTDSEYSEVVKTLADGLSERAVEIILSVTLCVLSIILLVAAIYAFARIRQKQKEGGTYSPRDAEIIDTKFKLDQLITVADLELKDERLTRYSSFFFRRKDIYVIQLLSYRKSLKPISKKAFLQHVEELCANNNLKFQEEFSELPKFLHDLATSDADLPWNRSKNRFTNIKPYNNNRVKLMADAGVPGSDYINASYVSGYICPNEFIATQGPLSGTVGDFWRMVWETKAKTIVMLSQCFEKGRIRCHQYWPEDNKPVTVFGDIVMTKLSEDVQLDWTVRELKVEKHGDFMIVRQCNFTSWPEHGVPESATPLIHFVKLIRANRPHENTPIVVHCSAGVGRTGLYVALDHLAQHINHHDFVDIYGLVAELRSERMCMVQNLAQYIFLHQCVLELLTTKGSSQAAICFVNYSALQKMDSLEAMEGDVELEWEETTM